MIYRLARLPLSFGLLLFCLAPAVTAQETKSGNASKWALEVRSHLDRSPYYWEFPENEVEGNSTLTFNLDESAVQSPDNVSHGPFVLVQVRYKMEGEAARLRVSVFYFSPEMRKLPDAPVEEYRVRPDESVTLSALSRFGLQPMEIKLVSARPREYVPPPIENKTASLVVEKVDEDIASYRLSLRNTSPLALEGFSWRLSLYDGSQTGSEALGHPLPPMARAISISRSRFFSPILSKS